MRFRSVYVAGHRGLVGSALVRNLQANGYRNILARAHKELDLRNPEEVRKFFRKPGPEAVVIAAAKVGGIPGEQRLPCGIFARKLADSEQPDRDELRVRRDEITVPRQLVYLSETGSTTDP